MVIGYSKSLLYRWFYLCLVYTLKQWNEPLEKNQRLLICSDNMMIDLYIVDADCLIHYDIPADKHKFSIRFSVLENSNNVFIVSPIN